MRRLLVWTAVTIMTVSAAGCCRSWLWRCQSEPCQPCMVCEPAPVCGGEYMAPAISTPVLPGPAVEVTPGSSAVEVTPGSSAVEVTPGP
jgi:hypothetical protein